MTRGGLSSQIQKLCQQLSSTLEADDDGWVPTERWTATQELHKLAFEHCEVDQGAGLGYDRGRLVSDMALRHSILDWRP